MYNNGMQAQEYLHKHAGGIQETSFGEMCVHRSEWPLLKKWVDAQQDIYFHAANTLNDMYSTGDYNCFRLRVLDPGEKAPASARFFMEFLSTGEPPEELRRTAKRLGYFKPGMFPILLKELTTTVKPIELDF